ncbi:TIGR03086 family protein [Mycolicibacterium sp. (ex Dasyatis americana)]|nr:TIGR03086 family protein [Mycolicibacterium sp. (ex Dasyatis americana)]
MVDLTKACERTAKLLEGVRDEDLGSRTPCEKLSVAELVAHIGGLAPAFAAAARKELGALTDTVPDDGAYLLDDDWRSRYPDELAHLAEAWRAPEAWDGMTRVAGFDLPGEAAGLIALTEVVIHGWDLAHATGQPYDVDGDDVQAVLGHVAAVAAEGPAEGLFGPAVPAPDDASRLERALALSGRRPRPC